MSEMLKKLIDSAREQADITEASHPQVEKESEAQKAARLTANARAQSQRDWADFAEKGIKNE